MQSASRLALLASALCSIVAAIASQPVTREISAEDVARAESRIVELQRPGEDASSSPASELPLPIDRRPVWLVNCFGGHFNTTTEEYDDERWFGVRPAYRGPEGAAWLANQIRKGYAVGARRFFVNRPMGVGARPLSDGRLTGAGNVPGSGWLPIPPYKRPAISDAIADLVLDEIGRAHV